MTRPARIARNIAAGLAALLVVIVVALLIVVQTSDFQSWVKGKLIEAISEGTGGATEIGSFALDLRHLHARISNLTIHGSEPAGAAPFAHVATLDLNAQLFSGGRLAGISYLGIRQPEVNVMVFPDGRTNVPAPKPSAPSKTTPLDTVIDLAVGHVDLTQGRLTMDNHPQAMNISANNLHVQLWYRVAQKDYAGRISLAPVYVVSGRNTPVVYTVDLPLGLERDAIRFDGASITTADSTLRIDGTLANLRAPVFSGHLSGRLALSDLDRTAGLSLDASGRGHLPAAVSLELSAEASAGRMSVSSLTVDLGDTHLRAGGVLKGGGSANPLAFSGVLDLPQLARLTRLTTGLDGSLLLNGSATLDAENSYRVSAHVSTRGLAVRQGAVRVSSAALSTDILAEPANVQVKGFRLDALGGEVTANASLRDGARYQVAGGLRHFDVQTLTRLFHPGLPYSGVLSGPVQATGDLNAPGASGLDAQAQLTIAPGQRGEPLSGRLAAEYVGRTGEVKVDDSFLALPHTRVTIAGNTGRILNISLNTTNLQDLLAASPSAGPPPVSLSPGGRAGLTAEVTGAITQPHVAARVFANRISVQGRQFDELGATLAASPSAASVTSGTLQRGRMTAGFSGRLEMRQWKPEPRDALSADLDLQNGDVADVAVLAGETPGGYSGALTAAVHVAGTVGNPTGTVGVHAANGQLHGEPFQQMDARIDLTDQLATLQSASIQIDGARIDLSGSFQHPGDSFSQGTVQASLRTSQVDLSRIHSLQNTAGQVSISANVTGVLEAPAGAGPPQSAFLLRSVQADAAVRALRFQGESYGNLQLTARTAGQAASFDLTSDVFGSNIRVQGVTELVSHYPTTVDAQISALPVERVLAAAGHGDLPLRGKLGATAHASGVIDNPQGDLAVNLTDAAMYGERIDRMEAHITNTSQELRLTSLDVASGPSHLGLAASFDHPAGRTDTGTLAFQVKNGHIDLARLRTLQASRPGLGGTIDISADGAAAVAPGETRVTSANANVTAAHLGVNGVELGGCTFTAHTSAANRADFNLKSDLAGANIQATGSGQLTGDYPVTAQLTFDNLKWTNVQKLLEAPSGEAPSYEISAAGRVTVNGPVMNASSLGGSLELGTLQFKTLPQTPAGRSITIENQGPVAVKLQKGALTVESFHLTGPKTDIHASGNAAVNGAVNLKAAANLDLSILPSFSRDIDSSGKITLDAGVAGTLANPRATGQLQLQDVNFNYAGAPVGLDKANGTIAFLGNRATIRNLTAESGGGKLSVTGFALMSQDPRFEVRATGTHVRVPVQPGVSVIGNADLQLNGVMSNSSVTGTVTLTQLNYAPQSDLGSMLTRAAPDVGAPTVPNPLLDHMKLDVDVQTSPAVRVKASLAEGLQMDAELRLVGTVSQPAMLGRLNLDGGKLTFFGSSYTVNTGSISFINPVRIEPTLNLSLETESKGVDVVLNVTGPLDNMKLTYTSDPPLQFQEIVSLLAAGTTPTSDPTLLANQPAQPTQSFEQSGESAILGQAVASPVASQLQRVFGLTQLAINPAFTSGSALPTAQVTLQQHITSAITFTYTSLLDDPNSTLIRAEWALNERWAANAVRDQNGIVSVNLQYKRQFH